MTDLTMASGLLNHHHHHQQKAPIIGNSQDQISATQGGANLVSAASLVEAGAAPESDGIANQIQMSNFESALKLAAEFLAHHHQNQQQFPDNPSSNRLPSQLDRLTFPDYQQLSRQSLLTNHNLNQTNLFANQQQQQQPQQVQTGQTEIQTRINQHHSQHRLAMLNSQTNQQQQTSVAAAIHAQLLIQSQV